MEARIPVEAALIVCEGAINQAGIAIHRPEGWPAVDCLAHPREMVQALQNVIQNACEAVSGSDPRWIKIDARQEGKSLIYSVSDSGPGLHSEIRGQIFQPFASTKGEGQGLGLGLLQAQRIAKDHGGDLTLHPNSPTGLSFGSDAKIKNNSSNRAGPPIAF